jgi:hypothetical protein
MGEKKRYNCKDYSTCFLHQRLNFNHLCLILVITNIIPSTFTGAFSPSQNNSKIFNSNSNISRKINGNIVSINAFRTFHNSKIISTRTRQSQRNSNKNINDNATNDTNDTFKKLSKPNLKRGSNYGQDKNSTIPHPTEVASKLGVKPTKEASAKEWQRAWKLLKRLLPLLHIFDKCKPPDSSLNLACMWWKAISGNDRSSSVCDNGLSYDILPSGFRTLVNRFFCRFYPRLHHANVELRTAFLDNAIKQIVDNDVKKGKKIRLICLGAGYDLRSIKLLERKWVDEAFELDLKQVVEAKQKLIGPTRLLKRRPWLKDIRMPTLIPSDLNNIDKVREQLKAVLEMKNNDTGIDDYHTIFVFEGVMIYLKEGIPSALLNATSSALKDANVDGSLCFADRLENIPGGDLDLGTDELSRNGWKLSHWCPKPGLARHMGSAALA